MLPQENTTALAGLIVTIHNGYYTVQTDHALVIYPLRGIHKQRYRKTALRVRGEHIRPEAPSNSISPSASMVSQIFPYRLLVAQSMVVGGFGMVIASVVGLMHYASVPDNPFAAYMDIFPGESSRAIEAHKFECKGKSRNRYQNPSEHFGHAALDSGVFDYVDVTYANGLIGTVHFEASDDVLSLGDLALFLNVTRINPKPPYIFTWQGRIGIAGVSKLRSPHFFTERRVWQVTLTYKPLEP